MNDFQLKFEWEEPAGASGDELRATWASFQICVGAEIVTELFDRYTKSEKERLYMPLYPLAEWVVEHWWHLIREPFASGRSSGQTYESRHCLLGASEGFALPDLLIQPQGSITLLKWTDSRFPNSPIQFLRSGQTYVYTKQVESQLRGLVESVVERLSVQGISGTFLQNEWDAINSVTQEELEFCEIAATLGLDPFNLPEDAENRILAVTSQMPKELIYEFFSASDPSSLVENSTQILESIKSAERSTINEALTAVRRDLSSRVESHCLPWLEGYEAARLLRKRLDGQVIETPSFDSLRSLFGMQLSNSSQTTSGHMNCFDAVTCVASNSSILLRLRTMHEQSARFALCRAVFEFVTSSQDVWRLVTHSRTEAQAKNRAFAAEFLAPANRIQQELTGLKVANDEIEALGYAFGVSPWVIQHQIENQKLAQIVD